MKLHLGLWLLGALIVGVIVWNSSSDNYSLDKLTVTTLNKTDSEKDPDMADRDNAAEEVRAVATKITNLEQIIESQNEEIRLEQLNLKAELEERYSDIQQAMENDNQRLFNNEMMENIGSISTRLDQLEMHSETADETVDFKLDEASTFVWYHSEDLEDPNFFDHSFENVSPIGDTQFTATGDSTITLQDPTGNDHYTIPPTTTLLNATALTALVGRIPVRGQIQDPWRFKIIVGHDNLAANGHRIPQLAGMIWVGTARGDLALSCVSGNLDTATFIFLDGSIQTTRNRSNTLDSKGGLGWISDEFGNPCISGELKSNALQYLAQSTIVDTTKATADALANAQTESRFDPRTGETNSAVVGNIDKFVAGTAVEESLTGVSQWLSDRQLSSFDAIYVPAGQKVAIHVEEPINIDYVPTARKIIQFDDEGSQSQARSGWID